MLYRPLYISMALLWAVVSMTARPCDPAELAEVVAVREATSTDAPAIFNVAQENRLERDKNSIGFLVGDYPLEYYQSFIDYSRGILLVATVNDVVAAFVTSADSRRFISRGEREDHVKVGLHRKLQSTEPRLKFILQVGVLPQFKHRALATRLYEALFTRFPNYHWGASIVEGPWENKPSVSFHRKLGFVNLAYGDFPHDRLGILHCGFYYREPSLPLIR